MAIVANKDGQDQFTDVHVYRPVEINLTKVGATIKPPGGNVAAGKPVVPPA